MKDNMISFFQAPVRNKTPYCVCSIASLLQYIKSDEKLKEVTEHVQGDLSNHDLFKLRKLTCLPYVTPGGVFERCCKDKLLVPSGDFVIDIDGLASYEVACQWRDTLAQDGQLKPDLVFVSPSMRGVKLFIPYRIEFSESVETCFSEAITAAWTYLRVTYDLQVDEANTDICRGCLVCHDADAKSYWMYQ